MKNKLAYLLLLLALSFSAKSQSAMYICKTVFIGNYTEQQIQTDMDKLLNLYAMPHTKENYLRVANALVGMRKDSKKGYSEMQILRMSIKLYTKNMKIGDLIGLAASLLEFS